MGNSLGGAVAMTLAANHPDRVASLLLVNSAGFGREANVSLLPMVYGALASLPVVGKRFRGLARSTGIQSMRDVFFDPSHLTDEMIRHAGKVEPAAGLPASRSWPPPRRSARRCSAPTPGGGARCSPGSPRPTSRRWWSGATPTACCPRRTSTPRSAALPNASSHLFPDTGHMPQLERAEEFAELAAAFVAEAADLEGSRPMRRAPSASLVTAAARSPSPCPSPSPHPPRPPPRSCGSPRRQVLEALTCKGDLAASRRQPVLFLHGTTSNTKANWSWNWNRALRQRGLGLLRPRLPRERQRGHPGRRGVRRRAIRIMHRRAGRDIDLVGHSQGGMIGRWALKFWPDTRGMVDDYVGLSSSNHGTAVFDGQCSATQSCTAANWQQQAGSNFLTALNAGRETYDRVDYTEISTQYDEVVVPSTSPYLTAGPNVTNVSVQELCPTETVEHFAMAYSNAAWLIGLDALTHRGPALLERVDASTCGAPYMPGVDPAAFPANVAAALAQTASSSASAPMYAEEPRVRCYARPGCPDRSQIRSSRDAASRS